MLALTLILHIPVTVGGDNARNTLFIATWLWMKYLVWSCITADVASGSDVIMAVDGGQAGAPPLVLQIVQKLIHYSRLSCQKDPMGSDEI